MSVIRLVDHTGPFAEDKDVAAALRKEVVIPSLKKRDEVVLDFLGVEGATQSFVHALISDAIRQTGPRALDLIRFKHCNKSLKSVIRIVTDYTQDHME